MNKLELLYKMMAKAKSKKECEGTIKVTATENGTSIISTEGKFYKNHETHDMKGSVSGFFIENGEKVELNNSVDIKDMKTKKKEAMKNCDCKCSCSKRDRKFGKAMFMLKLINEMKVSKDGEFNVISIEAKNFKKEHDKIHEMMNGNHAEMMAKKIEFMKSLGMPEEIIRFKMNVMKALFAQIDATEIKIFVNAENEISKVLLEGAVTPISLKIEVSL